MRLTWDAGILSESCLKAYATRNINMNALSETNSAVHESPGRLFLRFLRFGLLAWGGPVAQIAMIRHELVEEEKWISKERFNRVLAVYQALPGPEAHELCVYFGTLRGGRLGGLAAGLGFMLPGFLLMLLLSWVYLTVGITSPLFLAAFYGMQPAVVALIVRGAQRIGQHALSDRWLWGIAAIACVLQFLGVNFVLILLAAGLFYTAVRRFGLQTTTTIGILLLIAILTFHFGIDRVTATPDATSTIVARKPPPLAILGVGLRTGLLTFGGAYSAISFLRHDAVTVGGWLSDGQFLDGIALGGILPAPLIIFGTFVGYLSGGFLGALLLTVGIFAPAFGFSLIGHEWIERMVDTPWLHSFFDGVTAAVVGLIVATTLSLLPTAITDIPTALICLLTLAIVTRWKSKASTPLAVLLGALLGWLIHYFGLN